MKKENLPSEQLKDLISSMPCPLWKSHLHKPLNVSEVVYYENNPMTFQFCNPTSTPTEVPNI